MHTWCGSCAGSHTGAGAASARAVDGLRQARDVAGSAETRWAVQESIQVRDPLRFERARPARDQRGRQLLGDPGTCAPCTSSTSHTFGMPHVRGIWLWLRCQARYRRHG